MRRSRVGPLPIGEPGEELLDAPCGILRLFRVERDRFLLHPHRGIDRSRLMARRLHLVLDLLGKNGVSISDPGRINLGKRRPLCFNSSSTVPADSVA